MSETNDDEVTEQEIDYVAEILEEMYRENHKKKQKQKRFDWKEAGMETIKEDDELNIDIYNGEKIDIKPRKNHNVRIVNRCKDIKNQTTTILRTGGKEYTINGK